MEAQILLNVLVTNTQFCYEVNEPTFMILTNIGTKMIVIRVINKNFDLHFMDKLYVSLLDELLIQVFVE